jgi:hypothetical protein
MEETAFRYGGWLGLYGIIPRGQPTRGYPAWVFGEELTTPHRKSNSFLRDVTQGLGLGGLL